MIPSIETPLMDKIRMFFCGGVSPTMELLKMQEILLREIQEEQESSFSLDRQEKYEGQGLLIESLKNAYQHLERALYDKDIKETNKKPNRILYYWYNNRNVFIGVSKRFAVLIINGAVIYENTGYRGKRNEDSRNTISVWSRASGMN